MLLRRVLGTAAVATGVLLAIAAVAGANGDAIQFPYEWGGFVEVPHPHRENFCAIHKIAPGMSRPVWVQARNDGDISHGTLFCSPLEVILPATTGPWHDGWNLSIPCPKGERPMSSGLGFHATGAVTPAGGTFGTHDDGFWRYRFHNHNFFYDATVEFWAVCLKR